MIFKSLFRRRVRSLLTFIGIATGVITIVALRAIADGLVGGYTDLFAKSGTHLVLTQTGGSSSAGSMTLGVIEEEVRDSLAAMPNVQDVAGAIFSFVPMPEIPFFALFGYDPDQFAMQHFAIVEGRLLEASASEGHVKEILVGKRAAQNLKKKVGDTLNVFDTACRIVGIYETGVPFEDGGAVVALSEAQAIVNQPGQVTAYLLQIEDVDELAATRQQIEQRFPDISTSPTLEFVNKIGVVGTIKAFAWGISVIAMLVGGVGMMNTVSMSVFERTQEIGTLRALGWRKRRVFALILQESVLLSLLGCAIGVGLGLLLVRIIRHVPAVGSLSPGGFTPGLLLQILIVALGLGIIGGFLPAWWASRLVPLVALQYEGASATKVKRGPSLWGGIVFHNLWRSRARSLFTIVGVGIGVLALVTMGAFAEGFATRFSGLASGADLMVIRAGISDMQLSVIDQSVGAQIAAIPGVQHVSGGISAPAALEESPIFSLHGRDPAEHAIHHFNIVAGSGLVDNQHILLGKKSAESLQKGVGETLEVLGHSYDIVGVYETGNPVEEYGGVVTLSEAQALLGKPNQVGFFSITVQDPGEVERIQRHIEDEFVGLAVSKSADFAESVPDIRLTRGAVVAVTLLTALVGAIGLMNTMIMSVFEQTRQMGLLGALGWRRGRVLRTVLCESLILTLVGAALGIALGGALIMLLALSPESAGFPLQLGPRLVVQALGFALVLGILGGFYPAWWASRLAPIEALRHE